MVCRRTRLSYAQLDRRADRLAWELRSQGVQAGDIVAIFSAFDEDMFVGALGIMKAGCAYLPIDPSYPDKRMAYMLENSRARCVVHSQGIGVSGSLPQITLPKEDAQGVDPFPTVFDPERLAYVIYTSGSTGLPKGVMITQGALGNMVQWHNRYYGIQERDRSCKYASFSFDASVHEMFPQLAAGAEVHIIPEEIRMDMFAINRYLTENHINIGFLPTPICEQFVRQENHSLEKLIAGGDRMTRHSNNYTLYNNYGPTENTVVSTVYEVQGHESQIPIGKPIDGTRVYVLSREHRLQPIGITGELALAGRSLAKGYLYNPEQTAQRFVDDPFCPGEKMYLTGDLGHWMESGDLSYEGRMDNQYKIRGNRVEIGEIEAAALSVAGVSQALVRVLDGRLVLYTAGKAEEAALTEQLRRSLPSYMQPEAYVLVDALQYTVNSKPDFDAMPAPQFSRGTREFVPAEDPIEEALVEIWGQVLQTEPIGTQDNFFELGGNSLQITLLHYAVEERWPNRLTVGDLFAHPTVAAMAQALRRKLGTKNPMKSCLLALPQGRGGSVEGAVEENVGQSVLLAALAYSLHRCGKCREAVIYWEEEEKLVRCYTFDMQSLQTVPQLLAAVQQQNGTALLSLEPLCQEATHDSQRRFTVLLTPYGNGQQMDLVLSVHSGHAQLQDNGGRVAFSALQQLLLVFAKACGLFAQAAAKKPESYPLSAQQNRIYIAQNLLQEKDAYHIPIAFRLPPQTHIPRLCQGLTALVERHDIFRTYFVLEDGQLRQKVAPKVNFAPEVQQCEAFDPLHFDWGEEFDLSAPPLLRAQIVQTPKAVYLLLETHHIIFDGRSLEILKQELLCLYRGQPLPPVDLQYTDFCQWKPCYREDESYWKARFAEGIPSLELPLDRPRSRQRSYRCGVASVELEESLSCRLQELAAREGSTEFALFTAAAHLLFSRYCGQRDSILGTAMAGRTQARLQKVLGMFVNTVPLTAYVNPEDTFGEFLKQVSRSLAEAEEHQAYPFAQLIRLLGLESDGSRIPLIDVSIAFDQENNDPFTPIDLPPRVEKFDMSLRCLRLGTGARLDLSYCLDLFCEDTARNLLDSLKAILQNLQPQTRLREIGVLSKAQGELLRKYNETRADYDRSKTVCDLMDSYAACTKPAVVFQRHCLTYEELLTQSRQVAGVLQAQGLQEEEIVGVFLPRGLEMYPAIYGILKAGGAYMPMDPAYPDVRLQHMVKDSGLRYVFTTRAMAPRLGGLCQPMFPEELPPAVYEETHIRPDQLAYVIYTSGSSGLPKGVGVEHGSLINMVLWHQRRFGNCMEDVSTQYAGLGFDATVWEIFPYLAVGATIHVIPETLRLDMEALNAYYEANGVTISYLPTQICEQFMTLENHSLRLLHTAGDKLKHFRKRSYILMNNYGPTENTVVATTAQILEPSWNLPIGRPMDNCQVHILSEDGQLLPPGARGELCLAGWGLARGYMHREEENRTKFIPNPFGPGRLYKTGDLARWNAQGELEFLGRNDQQIKIRGNRIECGEIEAVLAQLPHVTQCAVVAKTRENGESYLLAYFCGDKALNVSELLDALKEKLPEYMVPSSLMQLPALPLTPNGKLDTKALPRPELQESTQLPASTRLQKELSALWQKLLGGEEPSVDQSFFALGGTSILMISLQRAIQERFGKRLTIAELFANPTIEKQEKLLDRGGELTLRSIAFPAHLGRGGSRVVQLSQDCVSALHAMGEEQAFYLSLTAFCYLLSSVTKEKAIPMQGRCKDQLFAGMMDFTGITGFSQAVEKAKEVPLETLPVQDKGLNIERLAGQKISFFVWNDADHLSCDDRADLLLRLCLSANEGSVRAAQPQDGILASALARLLEDLYKTEQEGGISHGR